LKAKISSIKMQRVMSVMSIVVKTSDLFIALAVVDPNPLTLYRTLLYWGSVDSPLLGLDGTRYGQSSSRSKKLYMSLKRIPM
jgi:hypothetical protein